MRGLYQRYGISGPAAAVLIVCFMLVPLAPTSGVHDLYFVFTNPDVKGDGFMFGVLTATFEAASR